MSIVILAIGVISTLSTTGYFVLALIISAFLVSRVKGNRLEAIRTKLLLIVLIIGGISILLMNDYVSEQLFGKLTMGTESGSFSARLVSVFYNIKIFLNNPFFGVGPQNYLQMFDYLVVSSGFFGMPTNTI